MFYATKIKSIGSGYVIDVQGKQLTFVGDFPCKVGDTVFSDGKFIFGHAPPRGSTAIFDEPNGIPILASSDVEQLRGYFTDSGTLKKYSIKGDEWIVNDKKKYAHDNEDVEDAEIDEQKIIDAEISEDGSTLIVADGFYRKCHAIKYHNHLYNMVSVRARENNSFVSDHRFVYNIIPIVGQEITLGADADDLDIPVTVYKDGEKVIEIPLGEYTQLVEEQCWRCKDELLELSADITHAINFIQQPAPPSNSFIALSYARVETFRIDPKGNWDAIISAAAYGHCFLYILLNGSLFYTLFADDSLRSFSHSLEIALELFEYVIFTEQHYPFLDIEHIEQYPPFNGSKKDSEGNYTDAYMRYIETKLQYYIPLVRFTHYKWEPFIFSSFSLFHVHNGDIVSTIINASGGGNEFEVTESWDEVNQYGNFDSPSDFISTPSRPYPDDNGNFTVIEKNKWNFPLGDDYFLHGDGLNFISIMKNDEIVLEISDFIKDNLTDIKILPYYPMPLLTTFDDVASRSTEDLETFNHIYITKFSYEEYEEALFNYLLADDTRKIYLPLWSHWGFDDFFFLNLSFLALKNSNALLGFHDGTLYKIDNQGSIKKVGDDLKNFRLRELKPISKAKK